MCFYNQKRFSCGDFSWTNFITQCNYEYRTGETCGMKLVYATEQEKARCRLCEKIQTKTRRRDAETERLKRWEREGGTLVASMEKSRKLIQDLSTEIKGLQEERRVRQTAC
ncbi:hypothetical protein BDW74DRAFT_173983 [Aspergillus multicolor]|uniref:uncharacterized protein n=1 Tax=Aspergillus multicolor TaxID=41759 RepID=UPI003CCDDF30